MQHRERWWVVRTWTKVFFKLARGSYPPSVCYPALIKLGHLVRRNHLVLESCQSPCYEREPGRERHSAATPHCNPECWHWYPPLYPPLHSSCGSTLPVFNGNPCQAELDYPRRPSSIGPHAAELHILPSQWWTHERNPLFGGSWRPSHRARVGPTGLQGYCRYCRSSAAVLPSSLPDIP